MKGHLYCPDDYVVYITSPIMAPIDNAVNSLGVKIVTTLSFRCRLVMAHGKAE